jgi:hypothetical protein
LETFSGAAAVQQLTQAEASTGSILLPVTGTSAGTQLLQVGSSAGSETFAGAASEAQLVQFGAGTGGNTFAGPFTGTIAGTQPIQTEDGTATGGTAQTFAGGAVIGWGQHRAPVAITGTSEAQQAPQQITGEAFNQQVVSGTSSTTQQPHAQQSHGFQEDEAEILAIILAFAA